MLFSCQPFCLNECCFERTSSWPLLTLQICYSDLSSRRLSFGHQLQLWNLQLTCDLNCWCWKRFSFDLQVGQYNLVVALIEPDCPLLRAASDVSWQHFHSLSTLMRSWWVYSNTPRVPEFLASSCATGHHWFDLIAAKYGNSLFLLLLHYYSTEAGFGCWRIVVHYLVVSRTISGVRLPVIAEIRADWTYWSSFSRPSDASLS